MQLEDKNFKANKNIITTSNIAKDSEEWTKQALGYTQWGPLDGNAQNLSQPQPQQVALNIESSKNPAGEPSLDIPNIQSIFDEKLNCNPTLVSEYYGLSPRTVTLFISANDMGVSFEVLAEILEQIEIPHSTFPSKSQWENNVKINNLLIDLIMKKEKENKIKTQMWQNKYNQISHEISHEISHSVNISYNAYQVVVTQCIVPNCNFNENKLKMHDECMMIKNENSFTMMYDTMMYDEVQVDDK